MVQEINNRFTVLLADEQEQWHQTVEELLKPQGVQTVIANNGREALRLLESTPVHVAVLDVQMPQLGGMQIVRLMRERKISSPTILLAGHMTNHLLHEALGMHVFSVLSKPVDFNMLLDSLARVLKRYHENRWPGEG
jgi:DNA-binding NtrC family response regulator